MIVRYGFLLLTVFSILSCDKENPIEEEIPEESTDIWEFGADHLLDSTGNRYYLAFTDDKRLQIRVRDADGKTIFSEYCPTIDSTEIPLGLTSKANNGGTRSTVNVVLTAPSRFINPDDATLSILLNLDVEDHGYNRTQLIANINLSSKEFYTKKYPVRDALDWSFVWWNGGVVQWHQNTLIVREGTQADLNGGGHMGLGSRGTQLVCYERDFSIRYTKDIDVSAAYYPISGGHYIPVSATDDIGFRTGDGVITRSSIFVSIEDQWAGLKPVVWQIDLKHTHNLPADYKIDITDYNVQGDLVTATYRILDDEGGYKETKDGEWDLATGAPRKKFND